MSQPIKYSNYTRPDKTYQDSLSKEQIKEKLIDYVRIDDIASVPINTHVRYFIIEEKNGKTTKAFRLGGFLSNKDKCDQYVILTNNKVSWSVNCKKAIFYKKMKTEEIYKNFEEKIEKLENEKNELKKIIENLDDKNKKLIKKLEK